jgi:predicted DNA-binding transcriptional regulator YafY
LVVSPYGIVLKDGVGYLVGVVDGYEDVRIFALHRARRAEVLAERRVTKKDFSLDDYIDGGSFGYRLGDDITLKARFSKTVARTVTEALLAADQKLVTEDDGSVVISARVPDTQQLRSWLLGFGPEAEVLAPKALRDWASTTARSLVDVYSKAARP